MSGTSSMNLGMARDLNLVAASDWPQKDFSPPVQHMTKGVVVVIKQSVLNAIHAHGKTRTDVEVCGVLVGNGYRNDHGPFVYVETSIAGAHSDSKYAQVTFTAETWNHIQVELDHQHPDKRVIGWYHTHPGFGIFLSGMDLFIHENFFDGAEQLAFVYDPLGGDEGLFVWRQGQPVRGAFVVDPDVVIEAGATNIDHANSSAAAAAAMTTVEDSATGTMPVQAADAVPFPNPRTRRRQLIYWTAAAIFVVLLGAVAWRFYAHQLFWPAAVGDESGMYEQSLPEETTNE